MKHYLAGVALLLSGAFLFSGCTAEIDQPEQEEAVALGQEEAVTLGQEGAVTLGQEEEPSEPQTNAQCCWAACYDGAYGYYGPYDIGSACKDFAVWVCHSMGYGFKDAKWDSC